MKQRKENLLAKFKRDPDGCLCLQILAMKRAGLFAVYEGLRQQYQRQRPGSKSREKTLGALLKAGNKLRAIKEAEREIAEAYEKVESMVGVEIGGQTHFRVSLNSDRRRSCYGKVKHSEGGAKEAAQEIAGRTGDEYDAYPCRHCPAWHVGHAVRGAAVVMAEPETRG